MLAPFAFTQPAEIISAESTSHVITALIFFDIHLEQGNKVYEIDRACRRLQT